MTLPDTTSTPTFQTRLTRLLGLRHPIVLPGMTYIAVPELVAAVCQAGGLGILASGGLSPTAMREAIARVRALTDRPFGVGCSLLLPGAAACAQVALDERVPVINISMGKGEWVLKQAHAYGAKVLATVANEAHARSAIAMGVDGLIVTGHEAAAHGGSVTSMVLLPAIRDLSDLPIIAAGGIADGRGLLAALSLGADGVAMGTRLATTQESVVHARTKQLIIDKTAQDTLYSRNFDTFGCRVMDTSGGRRYTARPLHAWLAIGRALRAAHALHTPWQLLLRDLVKLGPTQAIKVAYFGAATLAMRKAIHDGDHQEGVQLIGQSQGLVHDQPTVQALIERVLQQATAVQRQLQAQQTQQIQPAPPSQSR